MAAISTSEARHVLENNVELLLLFHPCQFPFQISVFVCLFFTSQVKVVVFFNVGKNWQFLK